MAQSRHGKRRGHARWLVVPVGFVASALLVWQSSYATFNAVTDNPGNSWSAGTVALTDNDSGSAMFAVSGLKPGDPATSHCIQLTYTGTLAATVKLYGTVTGGSTDIGPYLHVTIEPGSSSTVPDPNCTYFTASGSALFSDFLEAGTAVKPFNPTYTNYANGLTTGFAPTAGSGTPQTYSFRFTSYLDASAPNSVQGGSVSVTFTWEAQ